jgi:flagellar export protein FliJ
MKAFQFNLARVLQLRESEAKSEESKLEQMSAIRARMEAERDALIASFERAAQAVKSQQAVHPSELIALDMYKTHVEREKAQWASRIVTQSDAIEKQRARVIQARARVRLLEKLRERRKAEWQVAADREMQELAADFSAAQWRRERGVRSGA